MRNLLRGGGCARACVFVCMLICISESWFMDCAGYVSSMCILLLRHQHIVHRCATRPTNSYARACWTAVKELEER